MNILCGFTLGPIQTKRVKQSYVLSMRQELFPINYCIVLTKLKKKSKSLKVKTWTVVVYLHIEISRQYMIIVKLQHLCLTEAAVEAPYFIRQTLLKCLQIAWMGEMNFLIRNIAQYFYSKGILVYQYPCITVKYSGK